MANVPTTSWDETSPSGSSNISLGDNRIRELKTQMREVVSVDHKMDSSGQAATWGYHNQVTLIGKSDIGTGATNYPILGAQIYQTRPELVYTDESDNDVIITSNGYVNLQAAIAPNNVYIKAKDNAGSSTVDLIKANASDVAVIPDGSQMATSAAPSNDADISNKKYVDDAVAFGSWASKSANTVYQAATDGFVVAYGTNFDILTDGSNPPTTDRFTTNIQSGGTVPVRKNDYYKVTAGATNVFWLPIGG